jgi:hypothetical protein
MGGNQSDADPSCLTSHASPALYLTPGVSTMDAWAAARLSLTSGAGGVASIGLTASVASFSDLSLELPAVPLLGCLWHTMNTLL